MKNTFWGSRRKRAEMVVYFAACIDFRVIVSHFSAHTKKSSKQDSLSITKT